MQYRLDHAKKVLEKKYWDYKVFQEELYTTDLRKFLKREEKVYYFGALTVSENLEKCTLLNDEIAIITIIRNSQIIELFESLQFFGIVSPSISIPNVSWNGSANGQFRSFSLTLQDKWY